MKLEEIVTGIVLAASFAAAQPSRTPPDPATMVQRRVERLTTLLSLSAAQAQEATTIFTAAATADTTVRTNLQTARTSLNTAITNNDVSGITQASTTIGTLTGQITANDAKAQAAFLQILTADQRTKYNHGDQGPGFGGPAGFGPSGFRGRGGPPPQE